VPLPSEVDNALESTARVSFTELRNIGEDLSLPEDEYPFARIIEILDDRICPLCQSVHGMVIQRGTVEWEQWSRPSHINCRRALAWVHRTERAPDGTPVRQTFERPPQAIIDRYGHFVTDPKRYEPLRVPAYADRRQFIFRRKRMPDGTMRSLIEWQVPPYEIPALRKGTKHIVGGLLSELVATADVRRMRTIIAALSNVIAQVKSDALKGAIAQTIREALPNASQRAQRDLERLLTELEHPRLVEA